MAGYPIVRRARRRAIAVALAALSVAAAGCSTAGAGTSPPSPPATPATPSTPASPAPSPSTTGVASPGQVTVDPALPDAKPLPAGIWAQTSPGWVLATYEPTVVTYDDQTGEKTTVERTRQIVYLASPDGTRYQVLELDPEHPIAITSWTAGQSVAYIEECGDNQFCNSDTGPTKMLDLTTGAISAATAPAGAEHIALTLPGPVRLWFQTSNADDPTHVKLFLDRDGTFTTLGEGWERPQASPDGAWVDFERWDPQPDGTNAETTGVLNVAAGTLAAVPALDPAVGCSPYEWSESDTILEYCYDPNLDESWVSVDPATLKSTPIGSPLPANGQLSVRHDVLVAPGVWAGEYGTGGFLMWTDPDGTFGVSNHGAPARITPLDGDGTPLKVAWAEAAVGGVVYLQAKHVAVDEGGPQAIVAYDYPANTQAVLVPTPPGGPAAGALGADQEAIGMTSWVVAR